MIYKKLNRVSSNGYANYIHGFKEVFPELSKISSEDMAKRWEKLGIEFYATDKTPVTFLLRLSLPFALLTVVIMIIGLPFNFIITGNWGYDLGKKNRIYNWLKSLRLY